jgi:transcriptional regulator with XRE-family HTH domain
MNTLAARLRYLRGNMTMAEISKACGVSTGSLFRIENEQSTPCELTVCRLSAFFGARPEWLVEGSGEILASAPMALRRFRKLLKERAAIVPAVNVARSRARAALSLRLRQVEQSPEAVIIASKAAARAIKEFVTLATESPATA